MPRAGKLARWGLGILGRAGDPTWTCSDPGCLRTGAPKRDPRLSVPSLLALAIGRAWGTSQGAGQAGRWEGVCACARVCVCARVCECGWVCGWVGARVGAWVGARAGGWAPACGSAGSARLGVARQRRLRGRRRGAGRALGRAGAGLG